MIFKNKVINREENLNFRTHNTNLHITSGNYNRYVNFFHVLPWIFVIVDFVLGLTVFVNIEHLWGWWLVFSVISFEIIVMYLYNIFLGVYSRKVILKTFQIINLTKKKAIYISLKKDFLYQSNVEMIYNPSIINVTSKMVKEAKKENDLSLEKKVKTKTKTNLGQIINTDEIKITPAILQISIPTNLNLFLLKNNFINLELATSDKQFFWSSHAFLSEDEKKIRFLVKRSVGKLDRKQISAGSFILDSNRDKIKYNFESNTKETRSGFIKFK